MLIHEWEHERLMTVKETAKLLKKCTSQVYVWMHRGTRAPSGEQVRLEWINMGGRIYTSREAIQRWIERLSVPNDPPDLMAGTRDAARQVQRDVKETMRMLNSKR